MIIEQIAEKVLGICWPEKEVSPESERPGLIFHITAKEELPR